MVKDALKIGVHQIALNDDWYEYSLEIINSWKAKEEKDSHSQVEELKNELEANKIKLEKLLDLQLEGGIEIDEYKARKNKFINQNTELKGQELLKEFEGYRTHAYIDQAGIATIGYGTTKYEDGSSVKLGDKITKKKADELFRKDLVWAQNAVNQLVNVDLKQNQFDALVSFVYNIGEAQFKNSTLLRKLNSSLTGVDII